MVSLNLVPATPESTKYRLDWLSHFSLFMCRGFRFQTPWCQNLSKEILQTDLFSMENSTPFGKNAVFYCKTTALA